MDRNVHPATCRNGDRLFRVAENGVEVLIRAAGLFEEPGRTSELALSGATDKIRRVCR